MGSIATHIGLALCVVVAFAIGPGLAIAALIVRKRRRDAQRRSPINIDLLRGPGHSLRMQIEEAAVDSVWDTMLLAVIPVMLLALYSAQGHLQGLAGMTRFLPIYLLFALIVLGSVIRKMLKAGAKLDQLRAGFDAEVAVGQELDQLMRQGAVVFHDFPADGFNIDHVVISPQGFMAVETKGYTKLNQLNGRASASVVCDGDSLRFPTWTTKEPIEQAERQARWLAKWASSAIGEEVKVTPILALPGWFVDRRGRGPVRVFSGKELAGLLRSRGLQPLSDQHVQRIAHQVEQRCRTVTPTYQRREPRE